jgi:hypothetical protein
MDKKASKISNKNRKLKKLVTLMLENNDWRRPKTEEDYTNLQIKITNKLKEFKTTSMTYTMSPTTIDRLFGRESHKSFDISQTLNPLARLAGFENWDDYFENGSKKAFSLSRCKFHSVDFTDDTETLVKGSFHTIGWEPYYYLDLQYLGDCEFKILKYVGTGRDRTNDIISGRWFEVKREPDKETKPIIVTMFGDIVSDKIIF